MTEPLPVVACSCGWKRPLIAVSLASGGPPREELAVRYACPECGSVYTCGDVPGATANRSPRAHDLVAKARRRE
jgi:hypothetical protein